MKNYSTFGKEKITTNFLEDEKQVKPLEEKRAGCRFWEEKNLSKI